MSDLLARAQEIAGTATRDFDLARDDLTIGEATRIVFTLEAYDSAGERVATAVSDGDPLAALDAAHQLIDSLLESYAKLAAVKLLAQYGDDLDSAAEDANDALTELLLKGDVGATSEQY